MTVEGFFEMYAETLRRSPERLVCVCNPNLFYIRTIEGQLPPLIALCNVLHGTNYRRAQWPEAAQTLGLVLLDAHAVQRATEYELPHDNDLRVRALLVCTRL